MQSEAESEKQKTRVQGARRDTSNSITPTKQKKEKADDKDMRPINTHVQKSKKNKEKAGGGVLKTVVKTNGIYGAPQASSSASTPRTPDTPPGRFLIFKRQVSQMSFNRQTYI